MDEIDDLAEELVDGIVEGLLDEADPHELAEWFGRVSAPPRLTTREGEPTAPITLARSGRA